MTSFTAKEFFQYCLLKKLLFLFFILIGVFSSVLYNFMREDIYESKMTIKVNSVGKAPVQELVYAINQKYMLGTIDGEAGVLSEDYSKVNVYAKSSNDSGYVDIYVHGNSPESAQSSCQGIYEHIKYYNAKKKENLYETAYNTAEVVRAKELADEAFEAVMSSGQRIALDNGDDVLENFDGYVSQEKKEFSRKEYIYRAVLQDEIITLKRNLCDYDVMTPANLPTQPVSKRYPIVVLGAFMASVCVATFLLFVMYCIKRFQENNR